MKSCQDLFSLFCQFSALYMILCVNPFFTFAVDDIQEEALGNSLNTGVQISLWGCDKAFYTLYDCLYVCLCVLWNFRFDI